MHSNVSQPAVHSLLPTIHLCSSPVNSQTAERGNAAICKPGGGEAEGAEAGLSAVRRNRQRCDTASCLGDERSCRVDGRAPCQYVPPPVWRCSTAARTRSEELMPTDVIWTDAGEGTGQMQPLHSWEQRAVHVGTEEPSSPGVPHPSQVCWLQQGFSTPILPAPAPWGACCLSPKHQHQTMAEQGNTGVSTPPLSTLTPTASPLHPPVVWHHS